MAALATAVAINRVTFTARTWTTFGAPENQRSTSLLRCSRGWFTQLGERRPETRGQLLGRAGAPVVQEEDRGLRARHVMVNRHDVESVLAERLQHRCDFVGEHRHVPGDGRL